MDFSPRSFQSFWIYLAFFIKNLLIFPPPTAVSKTVSVPGALLTYFNDRGGGGVRVQQKYTFYTQKIPTTQKVPTFLAYPKRSLSVFVSANFYNYYKYTT